jgi:hypothetical protein
MTRLRYSIVCSRTPSVSWSEWTAGWILSDSTGFEDEVRGEELAAFVILITNQPLLVLCGQREMVRLGGGGSSCCSGPINMHVE